MKRTTIFIPETLEADLQSYARRNRKPAASVVREAIATFLSQREQTAQMPASIGAGKSGRTDVSERIEELLFEESTPHGLNRRPVAPKLSGRAKRPTR